MRSQLEELRRRNGTERLFNVYRTWADPRCLDLTLEPSDRQPGCYLGDLRAANYGAYGIARSSSLRTWLSMWSLEYDVLATAKHLPRVTVPALVIQGTADRGVFPANADGLHAAFGSQDKTLIPIHGANHYMTDPSHLAEAVGVIDRWLLDHDLTP